MSKRILSITIAALIAAASCVRNYHDETLEWIGSIKEGTPIEEVKASQPPFITIAWGNPHTYEERVRYLVTHLNEEEDQEAEYYLVFRKGKYLYEHKVD